MPKLASRRGKPKTGTNHYSGPTQLDSDLSDDITFVETA